MCESSSRNMDKTSLTGRVVVAACVLMAALFFSILAKGALFPELGIGGAILGTLAVGGSILAWYVVAEGIGTFLHRPSRTASKAVRLLVGLAVFALWSWVWFAGAPLLSALVFR